MLGTMPHRSSLNEPNRQRIAVVLTVICLDRCDQQEDQVNYDYGSGYDHANADERQRHP